MQLLRAGLPASACTLLSMRSSMSCSACLQLSLLKLLSRSQLLCLQFCQLGAAAALGWSLHARMSQD